MKDASKVFLGTHDFNNFISGTNDKTVTTIYEINFVKKFYWYWFLSLYD